MVISCFTPEKVPRDKWTTAPSDLFLCERMRVFYFPFYGFDTHTHTDVRVRARNGEGSATLTNATYLGASLLAVLIKARTARRTQITVICRTRLSIVEGSCRLGQPATGERLVMARYEPSINKPRIICLLYGLQLRPYVHRRISILVCSDGPLIPREEEYRLEEPI